MLCNLYELAAWTSPEQDSQYHICLSAPFSYIRCFFAPHTEASRQTRAQNLAATHDPSGFSGTVRAFSNLEIEGTALQGDNDEPATFRVTHLGPVHWACHCTVNQHHERIFHDDDDDDAEHYRSRHGPDHNQRHQPEVREGLRARPPDRQCEAGGSGAAGHRCKVGCSRSDENDDRRLLKRAKRRRLAGFKGTGRSRFDIRAAGGSSAVR
ncbi:MAG: hypothetical protein EOS45_29265 [Mesorhizobium sp.]|nr:hypothetical protein EN779_16835 [Mesorhizobium sp. M4B.F.Ca.ET.088.02.2.1]RWF26187.1 MAG: hypothetical protein EOS45_29265 [Mesorhizobium sp.]